MSGLEEGARLLASAVLQGDPANDSVVQGDAFAQLDGQVITLTLISRGSVEADLAVNLTIEDAAAVAAAIQACTRENLIRGFSATTPQTSEEYDLIEGPIRSKIGAEIMRANFAEPCTDAPGCRCTTHDKPRHVAFWDAANIAAYGLEGSS